MNKLAEYLGCESAADWYESMFWLGMFTTAAVVTGLLYVGGII